MFDVLCRMTSGVGLAVGRQPSKLIYTGSIPVPRSICFALMTEFPILNALIFSGLGILVFVAGAAVISKLAPFNLWKEIVQERNVAVAIVAGAVVLGICWIIAATMH